MFLINKLRDESKNNFDYLNINIQTQIIFLFFTASSENWYSQYNNQLLLMKHIEHRIFVIINKIILNFYYFNISTVTEPQRSWINAQHRRRAGETLTTVMELIHTQYGRGAYHSSSPPQTIPDRNWERSLRSRSWTLLNETEEIIELLIPTAR